MTDANARESLHDELPLSRNDPGTPRRADGNWPVSIGGKRLGEGDATLKGYDEAVTDIQEGLEDEAAGRVRPLGEVAAELRQILEFPR